MPCVWSVCVWGGPGRSPQDAACLCLRLRAGRGWLWRRMDGVRGKVPLSLPAAVGVSVRVPLVLFPGGGGGLWWAAAGVLSFFVLQDAARLWQLRSGWWAVPGGEMEVRTPRALWRGVCWPAAPFFPGVA